MATDTRRREEDSLGNLEEVPGPVTANCYISIKGVLVINGKFFGSVYFRGKISRECARCHRIKLYKAFSPEYGTCKSCRREQRQVRSYYDYLEHNPNRWEQDDEIMELLDTSLDLHRLRDDSGTRSKSANYERGRAAREALRELTE